MNVYNHYSLKRLNTFGIDVAARLFIDCFSVDDVRHMISYAGSQPIFVLGGGSNMLFLSDIEGVVARPQMRDIKIVSQKADEVVLRADAGVVWDNLVSFAVSHNFYGLENLSGIPGTVGASPVQNVGAYGAEAGQTISKVEGVLIPSGKAFVLSGDECEFGYRDSIFKHELKGKAMVTAVEYKLKTHGELNLDYGPVSQRVSEFGGATLQNVRSAIIDIRNSKLPNPQKQGSAGSFFKNPEVDSSIASAIHSRYELMPHYKLPNGRVKIPAGWLIEQAGWKGKSLGAAAVHDKQALVIVNNGGATGADVMNLANAICHDVKKLFGIELEMEVCKIGGK